MEELLRAVKETISQLQKIAVSMQGAVGLATALTKKAEIKLKAVTEKEEANAKKNAELIEREKEVAKVESVIKLKAEAEQLMLDAKKTNDKLDKEMSDFKNMKNADLKDIAHKRQEVNNSKTELEKEWSILHKEQKQLKEDKKKMREDILKELKSIA